jgi:hypothetical protein
MADNPTSNTTSEKGLERLSGVAIDAARVSPATATLLLEAIAELENARRDHVFAVLGVVFGAFDDGEDAWGELLLQIAIVMTAGHEGSAMNDLKQVLKDAKSELRRRKRR